MPKKKAPEYAKRKRAFDETLAAYRRSATATLGAMQYNDSSAPSEPNPARPTQIDFKSDVDRVIYKCVTDLQAFLLAYVIFDCEDDIEREMHVQKVLGDARHGLEQGMGAEFIRRRIHPVKKYFKAVRAEKRR
jgi:hypothetical protein